MCKHEALREFQAETLARARGRKPAPAALVDLMEELNRRTGTTFLFASHDAAVLERARRVVEVKDGRVV
ncbi:MAG: hypothetical protein ACREQ9_06275 [Candidatus Binatia bacterium]